MQEDEIQRDADNEQGEQQGTDSAPSVPEYSIAEQGQRVATELLYHPVGLGLILVVITFFAYQLFGGIITFLLFGLDTTEHIAGVRAVTVISQVLFLVVPAIVYLRLLGWKPAEALRLRMPRLLPLLMVVVSMVALQFAMQSYMEFQQHLLRQYLLPDALLPLLDAFEDLLEELYGKLLAMHTPMEALAVWLVVAVTPAICEEILFRGAVQRSFEKKLRLRWAFLLSGVIFSLFHLNPITFIPLALLGVYFSVIVWRGGSLAYAVIGHGVNNSIAVIAVYFFQSEHVLPADAATGTTSLPMYATSGVVALLVFVAAFSYFWILTRSTRNISTY